MSHGQGARGPNGKIYYLSLSINPFRPGQAEELRVREARWLREEVVEGSHDKTEKTLRFVTRYDPGETVWEFKQSEIKGTLNDERENAKTNTGDSRYRRENYELPPARPFKEALRRQVGNRASR